MMHMTISGPPSGPPEPSLFTRALSAVKVPLAWLWTNALYIATATSLVWLPTTMMIVWSWSSALAQALTPDNLHVGQTAQDLHLAHWFSEHSSYVAVWGMVLGCVGLVSMTIRAFSILGKWRW